MVKQTNNIRQFADAFLTYCRIENRTPKTIAWHEASLRKFERFCVATERGDIHALKIADIREYIAFLQNSPGRDKAKPMSEHSIATYVRSLRAWFTWLHDEEYIEVNPAARLKQPKTGEPPIEILSPAELRRILAVCSGPYALRDVAIVSLLYDTGLRASEVITARRDWFTDPPASLKVYGKGRKDRVVPIGRDAAKAVRRYLRTRKDDSEYLFIAKGGKPLTVNGLGQMLERKGELAGVHCNPHKFRHTFAVTYMRNGGGELALQRILGHTTLEMTRHYARLADVDLIAKHRAFSPLDNL